LGIFQGKHGYNAVVTAHAASTRRLSPVANPIRATPAMLAVSSGSSLTTRSSASSPRNGGPS
ncbi:MAG TPA: hypothetical protein PL072_09690, partial [Phycisphaerales bacterium]|nr:hypothetical protein [Phycisphaerales bacterium]